MPDAPIRIVHVLCALERGGAERLVVDLCRRLDPAEFQVEVATVMGGGPLEADLLEAGFPVTIGGRQPGRPGIEALARLRALFRRFRPHIVHTHLFAGDTWGRLAALTVVPRPILVSTEHNFNLEERVHHRWLKRALAPATARIVAVSRAVAQHASSREGLPADRIDVIPDGIDLERFPPVRAGDPGPGHRLVTVGRLVPQKGIDVLIEALREAAGLELSSVGGGPQRPAFELTVVGDGPQRPALEALARRYGLADRVRFVGDQPNVVPFLRSADILVQPSRWEGFGLTVVEAMATGLPVVASSVGGLVEVVADGQTGVLVPSEDPRALADALRRLAVDPARRAAMGTAGVARARERFGIDVMAGAYQELYRDLARPSGR